MLKHSRDDVSGLTFKKGNSFYKKLGIQKCCNCPKYFTPYKGSKGIQCVVCQNNINVTKNALIFKAKTLKYMSSIDLLNPSCIFIYFIDSFKQMFLNSSPFKRVIFLLFLLMFLLDTQIIF